MPENDINIELPIRPFLKIYLHRRYGITDGTELSKLNPILFLVINELIPYKIYDDRKIQKKKKELGTTINLNLSGYWAARRYILTEKSVSMINSFIYKLIIDSIIAIIEVKGGKVETQIKEFLEYYILDITELEMTSIKKAIYRRMKQLESVDAVRLKKFAHKMSIS